MLKSKSKSQKMRAQTSGVMDRLAPHVENARDKAAPVIADARSKAAPHIDTAVAKFTAEVLPVITAAVASASEATEEARGEAKKRGLATAAALKGEVAAPEKRTHKLRNLFVLLGLSGLAAMVAKKMSDREPSTSWQSSYTPTTSAPETATTPSAPQATGATAGLDQTPMGSAAAASGQAHDEGAAAPDEAAADAAEFPHAATTPDHPADEVRVDDDRA